MALTKISGSILKDPLNLGEVSIGGTLTYQDVTNVDSIGLGTFRSGINVSGGQLDVGSNIKIGNAGIITATELDISGDIDVDGHTNLDNVSIAGVVTATGYVTTGVGDITIGGELNLTNNGNKNRFIDSSLNDGEALHIRSTQGGDINHENMAVFTRGGACSFFDDGSSDYKFQTAAHGMNVNGDIHMGGTATTTNQNRKIFWTGFDKESTGDFTDTAEIRHTTNVHGISGSVLEIISRNDANDGIALNAGSGPISLDGNV